MPNSMHGPSFLRLGAFLLTVWFNRLGLFRSSLNENDLKTAMRPDMAEKKLMTFTNCES